MQSCSHLRTDMQDLALSSDSAETRKLAMIVAELCRKMEELERDLKEVRQETAATAEAGQQGNQPARAFAARRKPR